VRSLFELRGRTQLGIVSLFIIHRRTGLHHRPFCVEGVVLEGRLLVEFLREHRPESGGFTVVGEVSREEPASLLFNQVSVGRSSDSSEAMLDRIRGGRLRIKRGLGFVAYKLWENTLLLISLGFDREVGI